jgi:hypothetical protein
MPEKAERMLQSIIQSLRLEHKDWSEEKIKDMAYSIVQKRWEREYGKPAFT